MLNIYQQGLQNLNVDDQIGHFYEGKVKSSTLAYNQRKSREKRSLGKDPDRSWCHLHTRLKLFWLQSMALRTSAAAYECTAAQSMDPWAATKKVLH